MTSRQTGWIFIGAGIGMFLMNIAPTISDLQDWHGAGTPEIVGKLLWQLGSVIMAGIGGKLLPQGEQK